MSNTDNFIDEVADEMRRDRMFAVFRRFGWIAVLLVLVVVGGAAWNEWRKNTVRAEAEAFGEALLAAVDAPDSAARQAALADIAATGDRGAVTRLVLAADAVSEGDAYAREAAVTALREVAGDTTVSLQLRDLAALRLVILQGQAVAAAERRAALEAIAAPGRPYRPLAIEQLALLALEEGDQAAALGHLRPLVQDQEAPEGLRRRVGQMIVVLEGVGAPAE